MQSIAFAAAVAALAASVSAQSFATGGVGRFPCANAAGTGADATQCTNAAMTANQVCPAPAGSEGAVDGNFKSYGTVPASASCIAVGSGFFCGFAGASCIDNTNCDNGSCQNSVCVGDLGLACTLDSQCSGNIYCTDPNGDSTGACGNLGADGTGALCSDGCVAGNFLCYSTAAAPSVCDGNSGTCVAAATSGISQRARSRRDLTARGSKCPMSQTACSVPGSAQGFECVDTESNLEQCGACAANGGVDCTALTGVDAVGCVAGQCEIWACAQNFAWSAASASCEPALTL